MVVVSGGWVKSVVYPNSGDVIATSKMAAKAVLICRPNSHPFQVIVHWNYGYNWVFYGERSCIFMCLCAYIYVYILVIRTWIFGYVCIVSSAILSISFYIHSWGRIYHLLSNFVLMYLHIIVLGLFLSREILLFLTIFPSTCHLEDI
jgi:hypothetical protein